MKANKNIFKLLSLNIGFTIKNKFVIFISSVFIICSVVFPFLYLSSNEVLQYTKLRTFSYELISSSIILGIAILFITFKLFFSVESKNLQDIEQRYGLKLWKIFIYRLAILILFVYVLIFIYFFIQLIIFSTNNNFRSNMLYWVLPKLNGLLYSLVFIPINLLLTLLFVKSNLASILSTLIMIVFIGAPTIIGNASVPSVTDFNQVKVNEINKSTTIGFSFYDNVHRDIDLWNNKTELFGDGGYFGGSNFNSIGFGSDENNDVNLSSYNPAFFMGQSLNLFFDKEGEKQNIMGFNDNYYDIFLTLKNSIEEPSFKRSSLRYTDLPFYKEQHRNKEILDLTNTIENLKDSNFNNKYPNLFSWIENNWNFILNDMRGSAQELKLYASYWINDNTDIDQEFFPDINGKFNDFYKEYPEFLAVSQIINAGYMNSFQPTLFEYTLDDEDYNKHEMMTEHSYNKIISKARKSTFLNIFNLSVYQSMQYVDIEPLQINQLAVFKFTPMTKINFDTFANKIYNNPFNGEKSSKLPTKYSLYGEVNLKITKSPIIVYAYVMQIILIIILLPLTGWLYIKKRRT